MAGEYSIILKGKSIASLISFAAKKLNVPVGNLSYEILAKPTPPENLFKLRITADKKGGKSSKKQKLKFSLQDRKTKLYLTAFPPEPDESEFDVDDVVDILVTKHKVAVKIDKWEIEKALKISTKMNKAHKVLIAKGSLPEIGDDGVIELLKEFTDSEGNVCESYVKKPVDMLYKCELVDKDEIIAIVHKPKKGSPGKDVFGKPIEGVEGKPVEYSVHKHIICVEFPNRIELRAPTKGRVTFYKNLFRFYEVVEHEKPLTGKQTNIKVDGDLIIDEYIENGAKVNVKGNLQVKDDIFNAFVDCYGDLTVENGISNSKNGFISINGNLNCSFLQKAVVWVENDVVVEKNILNSKVYGGGKIDVKNNGIVRGSKIYCYSKLVAGTIDKSEIRCGIPFSAQQRLRRLEKTRKQLNDEKLQFEKKIGRSFLNIDIRKLALEKDIYKDLYKKRRELDEINLNLTSVEKEIVQLINSSFNYECELIAKNITKGSKILMKNEELDVEKNLINVRFFFDKLDNKIVFAEIQ
jgi:uncharacterized protein (DUF342 family)